jgi:hypothetical protein
MGWQWLGVFYISPRDSHGQRLWLAWIREAGVSAGKVEVLHASCWDYFIHAGCNRHITPQGAGVATGPVKFVVAALRRLDWTWEQVGDWAVCTYVCVCGGNLDGAVGCWS